LPDDVRIALAHDIPLVWRQPANGREWLAAEPAVTPVTLRGVDIGALPDVAPDKDVPEPSKAFEGRRWIPTPLGGDRRWGDLSAFAAIAEGRAGRYAPVTVAFGAKLCHASTLRGELTLPDVVALNAILRPEAAARAWATDRVAGAMIQDGTCVYCLVPTAAEAAARRIRDRIATHGRAILEASRGGNEAGPILDGDAGSLRRALAMNAVDALAESDLDAAIGTASRLAHLVLARTGGGRTGRAMREALGAFGTSLAALRARAPAPADDLDALETLAP